MPHGSWRVAVSMMQATCDGTVLARSDRTIRVEGNHYFPIEDVEAELFADSPTRTLCYWKGVAHYRSVVIDGNVHRNAAWVYPKPWRLARKIKGHVAFAPGIEIRRVSGTDDDC